MTHSFDVAIVGGGIVGLAHAWMAAVRGLRVILFERSARPVGASIRNFGMIWPIGQPAGEDYQLALRSRALWLLLARDAGLWVNPCGSLHLAHREDEWAVLQEFVAGSSEAGSELKLLDAGQTKERTPAAKSQGLLGSLWSAAELCVHPQQALAGLTAYLIEKYQVQCLFETSIVEIQDGCLRATDNRCWRTDRTLVCSGSDLQTLFPETYASLGLRVCKLQMLKTVAQPKAWRIGPHLASGLTLRHYRAFDHCPSLLKLKARIQAETPELDQFGIHVMASQNDLGQVNLGDSHEYDQAITPFDRVDIDELILRELRRQIELPDWSIEARWHGIYVKHPSRSLMDLATSTDVAIRVTPGGAGMTLSFGWADQFWSAITNQEFTL